MFDADAIRELRKRLGLTAQEFGELLGVSWSTVCYWERGERHPVWKHQVKLNDLAKRGLKSQPA